MIESMLDNDLYKLTMQQAVHQLYPHAEAEYTFINRGGTEFPGGTAERLQESVYALHELRLSINEREYLTSTVGDFLTPVYINFLKHYRYDSDECTITQTAGRLEVSVKGPWYRTILWEVPLLAMISELYFTTTYRVPPLPRYERQNVNLEKARRLAQYGVALADFGTRRRYSSKNQDEVLGDFLSVEGNTLVGTSNVHFARKHNIKPIGTFAHEWVMFHGAVNGYRAANRAAIDAWTQVYQGNLGIALTDTYTSNAFFEVFARLHAKLFDGVRQDSGDPFTFADQAIQHYEKLGIDPLSKTIVFSDSLSVNKAVKLQEHCTGRIKTSFGIGTHLTNDVGVRPLNMVIKMTGCRERGDASWRDTVKLSDDKGKHTGNPSAVELCQRIVKGV